MLEWLSNPGVIFWLVGMSIAVCFGRLLSATHEENVKRVEQTAEAPRTVFQQLAMACAVAGAYEKGTEYALLGLAAAPDDAQLYGLLAINYAGLGDIANARDAFARARLLGTWVERALTSGFAVRNPEHLKKAMTLLRIAAGLEDSAVLSNHQ
ncbi:hypothetical protein [Variovorax sp. dw_954]|uniref:hypothetical protein n=1 Tax=Variovorax sp. dw_954 TaxID=2720078 RepID=UPI001BD65454|nr:hypothetical protein [Variovorax sp. dw_954]